MASYFKKTANLSLQTMMLCLLLKQYQDTSDVDDHDVRRVIKGKRNHYLQGGGGPKIITMHMLGRSWMLKTQTIRNKLTAD